MFRGWDAEAPAIDYEAITPGDTSASNHSQLARGFYCGGDGNVAVVSQGGTAVTLTGCVAGQVYAISSIRVNSTNTTATNLVALF